jgi:outer membrane protein OmpA-like peptidoglycan-associated protein
MQKRRRRNDNRFSVSPHRGVQIESCCSALQLDHLGRFEAELASQKEDITANRQRIQQNMQDIEDHTHRFMALTDLDVKGNAVVKFDVGSSKLSPESEEQLKSVVQATVGAVRSYR